MAGDQLAWRKSSYSGTQTDCVEVAPLPGATAVRDSKRRDAGELRVAPRVWKALIEAVRSGRL